MSASAELEAPHLWIVLTRCHRALSQIAEHSIVETGLGLSDFAALEALLHKGPLTITQIQATVLLASGSMTAAVDRLEKAGLARRERSETDRRKVFIRLCDSSATRRIAPIFEALGKDAALLATRYSTRELETIKDFCDRCIEMMRRHTEKVMELEKK